MNEKLKQLLQEKGLESYISLFETEGLIEQEDFKELTETDYEKIGIAKLGDRKRLLKLFVKKESSSDETGSEEAVVDTPVAKSLEVAEPEEYGEIGWDWVKTDVDGRHLIYRYGDSSIKYCPKCYRRISAHDTSCPKCGNTFAQALTTISSPASYSSASSPSYIPNPQPVVVNNLVGTKDDKSDTAFSKNFTTSFHGILGGTFGALLGAAIVIIVLLVILSNETITL